MQILAVSGRANEGKTTTIKHLISILLADAERNNHSIVSQKYKDIDIVKVIDLNLIVAFGQDGDYEGDILKNCTSASEVNADIFIQTTRTKGRGVDNLFLFAKNTHDIIQIRTISSYFGLKSKFFTDEDTMAEINKIQTENVWKLMLYILQKDYKY